MNARALLLSLIALAAACQYPALAAERIVRAPAAVVEADEGAGGAKGLKTAIFAGGCFWGVEGVFSHMAGVKSAVSGYHGGSGADAAYERVGSGRTGHAEAVRVTYDPAVIRYDELLRVFFSVVTDPTQLDRQGPDVGSQYRSALVPTSLEQKRVAAGYLAQLGKSGLWDEPIVTRIEPLRKFYPAESHHQDFMARNPRHPYIKAWDAPKVAAFAKLYPALYRDAFTKG
ncbi:MAG TPA: peptide-methionine (S)-S-oxide reductase MsrA [Novosphingobium sp.]|nr:peptide-methionine (S)-S-oxide reductase MsrA [Novosphingobium sp.]